MFPPQSRAGTTGPQTASPHMQQQRFAPNAAGDMARRASFPKGQLPVPGAVSQSPLLSHNPPSQGLQQPQHMMSSVTVPSSQPTTQPSSHPYTFSGIAATQPLANAFPYAQQNLNNPTQQSPNPQGWSPPTAHGHPVHRGILQPTHQAQPGPYQATQQYSNAHFMPMQVNVPPGAVNTNAMMGQAPHQQQLHRPPQAFTGMQYLPTNARARPYAANISQATRQVPQQQVRQPPRYPGEQAMQRGAVTIISERDHPRRPHGRESLAIGLHQVGLRSPRRVPAQPARSRFFQYVKELVVLPFVIQPEMGLRVVQFAVSQQQFSKLSRNDVKGGMPVCAYAEGSLRYRLRLCRRTGKATEVKESDWVVAESHWPGHIMFELNGHSMDLRRRQHFHKDLPLELTDHILLGQNKVRISLPRIPPNIKDGVTYFIAVEAIETHSQDYLMERILSTQRINPAETRNKVQRRLRPSDSDDVIIEDERISVSLTDPFSFSVFEVPVRGVDCRHLECFDLKTWFSTRPRKPAQKGDDSAENEQEPSMVDVWKCPICDVDVRPHRLQVDDFFINVRDVLTAQNNNRVRTINIEADGSWTAVEEPDDSEDEDFPARSSPQGTVQAKQAQKAQQAPEPLVIEILDD